MTDLDEFESLSEKFQHLAEKDIKEIEQVDTQLHDLEGREEAFLEELEKLREFDKHELERIEEGESPDKEEEFVQVLMDVQQKASWFQDAANQMASEWGEIAEDMSETKELTRRMAGDLQ